ncbi:ribbon-helix-helix protein, CopG family [Rodentibacter trehalosifermentans]|uniref:Ribbon-helix-helix protein, CopG family n=1 Tax=Rodentibacter trehalosifermentans TaxID=1908263 RepID=A0A1V3J639_9PAST|nr:ribbon-helix-helix protein, CopG family [Rodentibacter trehalosifermentans]OOF50705.1 ribbon-helix-helix protein, CopG family [Rodentibacter trehalosifermentans]
MARGRPKSDLTLTEIQKRSEEKRGIKLKGFKLPITVIAEIEQLSHQLNIPQNQLIIQAVELFKSQKGA